MFERDNLTPITGININVRENHSIWSENTPYGVLGRIIINIFWQKLVDENTGLS